jgi:hypothetical protein
MFEFDSDNDRIKQLYGNYNLWAWLRYWYLDTENQIAMMLIDKQYYDYDYQWVKPKKKPEEYKPKSNEEMGNILKRFGFNTELGKASKGAEGAEGSESKDASSASSASANAVRHATPEEIQKIVMN